MGAFLGYGLCFAETLVIILGDYFISWPPTATLR